jgi:hypothetical protein
VRRRGRLALGAAGLVAAAVAVPVATSVDSRSARPVSFAADVQPIFDQSCTACHPTSYPYLDLRRGRSYAQLLRVPAATNPAFARVLPGRPELSYLLTHPPDPSNADLLGERERRTIERWIDEGAPDN